MSSLNLSGFRERLNLELWSCSSRSVVHCPAWQLIVIMSETGQMGKAEILQVDRERDISNLIKLLAWTHTYMHAHTHNTLWRRSQFVTAAEWLYLNCFISFYGEQLPRLSPTAKESCVSLCVCFSNAFPIQAVPNNQTVKNPPVHVCTPGESSGVCVFTWWTSCQPFSSWQQTEAWWFSRSSQQPGSPPTTTLWYRGVRPRLSL